MGGRGGEARAWKPGVRAHSTPPSALTRQHRLPLLGGLNPAEVLGDAAIAHGGIGGGGIGLGRAQDGLGDCAWGGWGAVGVGGGEGGGGGQAEGAGQGVKHERASKGARGGASSRGHSPASASSSSRSSASMAPMWKPVTPSLTVSTSPPVEATSGTVPYCQAEGWGCGGGKCAQAWACGRERGVRACERGSEWTHTRASTRPTNRACTHARHSHSRSWRGAG